MPEALAPEDYSIGQKLGAEWRAKGSDGLVYPSVRYPIGTCAALFYPDLAHHPVQGRHLDYHWNGARVDYVREAGTREVFEIRGDT